MGMLPNRVIKNVKFYQDNIEHLSKVLYFFNITLNSFVTYLFFFKLATAVQVYYKSIINILLSYTPPTSFSVC